MKNKTLLQISFFTTLAMLIVGFGIGIYEALRYTFYAIAPKLPVLTIGLLAGGYICIKILHKVVMRKEEG